MSSDVRNIDHYLAANTVDRLNQHRATLTTHLLVHMHSRCRTRCQSRLSISCSPTSLAYTRCCWTSSGRTSTTIRWQNVITTCNLCAAGTVSSLLRVQADVKHVVQGLLFLTSLHHLAFVGYTIGHTHRTQSLLSLITKLCSLYVFQ
jgi:hypothetical protein